MTDREAFEAWIADRIERCHLRVTDRAEFVGWLAWAAAIDFVERERCAKVCEKLGDGLACDEVSVDECAAAIRGTT